jgi:hypothetical protein
VGGRGTGRSLCLSRPSIVLRLRGRGERRCRGHAHPQLGEKVTRWPSRAHLGGVGLEKVLQEVLFQIHLLRAIVPFEGLSESGVCELLVESLLEQVRKSVRQSGVPCILSCRLHHRHRRPPPRCLRPRLHRHCPSDCPRDLHSRPRPLLPPRR